MKTITPKTGLELAARIFELARRDPIDLSEQLLTNDMVEQVLQEGLILYIKEVKTHMVDATDAALLVPRVNATYAIDESDPETIEVTRWFAWAGDEELRHLRDEGYGDITAANVIAFLAFFEREVEAQYFRTADPQVMCRVNQKEAEAWMAVHRPGVLSEHNA